jgi:hypothetical protein
MLRAVLYESALTVTTALTAALAPRIVRISRNLRDALLRAGALRRRPLQPAAWRPSTMADTHSEVCRCVPFACAMAKG